MVWTDSRLGRPAGDLVGKLLICLKPLEEVVRGRLFFSLFIMNVGQAKRSLKGHLFGDRTCLAVSQEKNCYEGIQL